MVTASVQASRRGGRAVRAVVLPVRGRPAVVLLERYEDLDPILGDRRPDHFRPLVEDPPGLVPFLTYACGDGARLDDLARNPYFAQEVRGVVVAFRRGRFGGLQDLSDRTLLRMLRVAPCGGPP